MQEEIKFSYVFGNKFIEFNDLIMIKSIENTIYKYLELKTGVKQSYEYYKSYTLQNIFDILIVINDLIQIYSTKNNYFFFIENAQDKDKKHLYIYGENIFPCLNFKYNEIKILPKVFFGIDDDDVTKLFDEYKKTGSITCFDNFNNVECLEEKIEQYNVFFEY